MINEFEGNVDLIPLLMEDITQENERDTPEEEGYESALKLYKPKDSKLRINIDFDNYFIVLYPILNIGSNTYLLNDDAENKNKQIMETRYFMSVLQRFLSDFQIRQSSHFPTLLTLPVVYTNDILDFLLKAVPQLAKVATIYYTNNFKKIMIKKSLKVSISCFSGSIDQYLECDFTYDESISPEELEANELLKQMEQAQESISKKGAIVEKCKEELQSIKANSIKIEADISNFNVQKSEKEIKLKELADNINIEHEIKKIDEKLAEYVMYEKKYTEKLQLLDKQHKELDTKKSVLANQKEIYSQSLENEDARLDSALLERGFTDSIEVEKSVVPMENQDALKKEIKKYSIKTILILCNKY